jgi:hypothetical protein
MSTTTLNQSAQNNLDEIEQEFETSSQYFKPKPGKVYMIKMDPQNDKIIPVENEPNNCDENDISGDNPGFNDVCENTATNNANDS